MGFDPSKPLSETNYGDRTRIINGQPYVWQPANQAAHESNSYLGLQPGDPNYQDESDYGPDEGPGSWVPASFKNPNGTLLGPKWMLPAMLAGPAIASGLGAAFSGAGAGAGAGASTPSLAPGIVHAAGSIPASLGPSAAIPGLTTGTTMASAPFWSPFGTGGGLLNIGGNIASGIMQGRQASANRELQQKQLDEQKREFDAQQAQQKEQFGQNLSQTQGQQALNANQMDPFVQAKAREKQALLAALLGNYQPVSWDGSHASGGIRAALTPEKLASVLAFMSPEAMQANEQQFTTNAQNASGGKYVGPNFANVGYSNPSFDAKPPGGPITGLPTVPDPLAPPPQTQQPLDPMAKLLQSLKGGM